MAATLMSTSAHAFMVDKSQQRTITVRQAPQPAPQVQPAVVHVQQTTQQFGAYAPQSEPFQPVSYEAPTPPASTTITQTKSIVPASQVNTTTTTTPSNFATQSAYVRNANEFDRLAVTTNSSAVAVVDLQTGNLIYEKNIDAQRSIASVSKVMTAMVIMDAELDMREEITIIPSDLVGAKRASTNLRAGDRLSRSEFTLMMLMKSENPAAKALARTYPGGYDAFIAAMNEKARSLGMYQTSFADSSGLDPRNVSSASDLIKMMRAVNSNPRYQTVRNFSTAPSYDFYVTNYNTGDRTLKMANTSRLVRAGGHPIGVSKTGYIREAGYCVVMETHVNNRPAIVVLLGASASNNRWADAENILTQLAYRN
ncbi:peptidase S11 [Moraxella caviae]|nr:peptidase S11 [Moraxella caviae]